MDHEMLKAIADLLDEKLEQKLEEKLEQKLEQKFNEKLAPIHAKLDEHSAILKDHSEQLGTHSIMLKEQYGILKALEHSAEVNAAERDRTQHDIAYIKGSVQGLHRDMARIEEISAYNMAEIAKLKAAQ